VASVILFPMADSKPPENDACYCKGDAEKGNQAEDAQVVPDQCVLVSPWDDRCHGFVTIGNVPLAGALIIHHHLTSKLKSHVTQLLYIGTPRLLIILWFPDIADATVAVEVDHPDPFGGSKGEQDPSGMRAEGIPVLPTLLGEDAILLACREGRTGRTQQFPDLGSAHSFMNLMELLEVLVRTGKEGKEAQQEQYSRCTGHNGHAIRGS